MLVNTLTNVNKWHLIVKCYLYMYMYSSQHLMWIKKVNQSCPIRQECILVLGQIWWKVLIHVKCWHIIGPWNPDWKPVSTKQKWRMSSGLNSVVSKYHVQPHICMTVMSLQNPIIKWNRHLLVPKYLFVVYWFKTEKTRKWIETKRVQNTVMYEI